MKTYWARLFLGGALALSSCALVTVPVTAQGKKVTTIAEEYTSVSADSEHQEAFLRSFADLSTSGISFTLTDASVKLGSNLNNVLSIASPNQAKGSFVLHGLSLHEICLDLFVPINYNG